MTELALAARGSEMDTPVRTFDQRQITLPTGLVLNSEDQAGVEWRFDSLEGWDTPASTGSITQRAFQHGGWASKAFYASRVLAISGTIVAPTAELLRDAKDRLADAIPLDELGEIQVTEVDLTRSSWARQDGAPILKDINPRATRFSVQLAAPDPRRLRTGPPETISTGLPSSSGGLSAPFTVPFTIDATTDTGVLTVDVSGTIAGPVKLRIDGPAQLPTIRHEESGRELAFDLILDAGQWLDIDLDRRTVLLNGQASRRGLMRGRWFTLTPGTNTLSWSSLTTDPDAALTVTWRDAWK